jgi:hypothetical protein
MADPVDLDECVSYLSRYCHARLCMHRPLRVFMRVKICCQGACARTLLIVSLRAASLPLVARRSFTWIVVLGAIMAFFAAFGIGVRQPV